MALRIKEPGNEGELRPPLQLRAASTAVAASSKYRLTCAKIEQSPSRWTVHQKLEGLHGAGVSQGDTGT